MDSEDEKPKLGNIIPFEFSQKWKSSKSARAEDEYDHAPADGEHGAAPGYNWMADDKGKPFNNLANALATLRHDPALNDSIILDEMLQTVCLVKPLPGTAGDPSTFVPRPITDHDVTSIQEYLQHAGLTRIGKDLVHQAVDRYAQDRKVHPIRDWLSSTSWDGVERVKTWLTNYLGAVPTPYSEGVGKMALIAMVARIMEPGCKVDHMLVLEGPQGVGKSAVCKILGGVYFSDTLPEINGHKDAYGHLAGKWIIEAPEMSAMTRAETNRLKAFVTGTVDRFRPVFDRKEVQQKRQCVFIGTTNNSSYLKDPTGGRRFWPVRTGKINLACMQVDREQLFAEAMVLYDAGEPWHPSKEFEMQYIVPEQEDRFETDPWEPIIGDYLKATMPERVYLPVLFEVLHIEPHARGRAKQNRIIGILDHLGWRKLPKDGKGNVSWGRPPA